MSYVTIPELRKVPYKIAEAELDNDAAQVLLDLTKDTIDTLTRQDFLQEGTNATPVSKLINGNEKRMIALPKRLVSLTEVKIILADTSTQTHPATSFLLHESGYLIEWKELVSTGSARIRSEVFPIGRGNIEIRGVWGYAAIPPQIKYLQGRMIQKLVKEGAMAEKNSAENLGDFSFARAQVEGSITGDRDLDLIIRRNRRFKFDGAV